MDSFDEKQAACKKTGTRYYGDGGTIHGTQHVDVETDSEGNVVALWFRCQPLPFRQIVVSGSRAAEMQGMYSRSKFTLHGVEMRDPDVAPDMTQRCCLPIV